MIPRRQLLSAKREPKRLTAFDFKPARSRRLPKPFDRLGTRVYVSGLMPLGADYRAVFVWRDGPQLSRRSFYGHLVRESERGLIPLAILHYHPSHKGLHGLINCEIDRDFAGRHLPGGREFELKGGAGLDPALESDRSRLIAVFCERFGVILGGAEGELLEEAK